MNMNINDFLGKWKGTLTLKGQSGSQSVSVVITRSAVTLDAGQGQIEISLSGLPLFDDPHGVMLCAAQGTFGRRKGLYGLRVFVPSGSPLTCNGSIFKGSLISIDDTLVGGWTATRQSGQHRRTKRSQDPAIEPAPATDTRSERR